MNLLLLAVALLGGLGIFSIFFALAVPRFQFRRAQSATLLEGIQVTLQRAKIEIEASTFLWQGAALGAVLGLLAALIVGTPVVFLPFLLGGYVVLWVQLEDRRNQRINQYHHDLATAMSIIVNSWRSSPSLSGALEAVTLYGPGGSKTGAARIEEGVSRPEEGSVADDFDTILRALHAGTPLRDALQRVADRRRSPIFDGLATALLVAEEQGSQAGEMLGKQAQITHEQVETFHEALSRQRSARSEVRNGTIGPWAILGLVRLMGAAGAGGMDTSFFRTFPGTVTAIVVAIATVGMYAWAMRIAGRGLILTRVPTEFGKEVSYA